ncbi:DUF3781 domain-containing protein [Leuconostoc suionicum]|uniref:DUF3781 domain-containing protein n=1 Tax=Leuconostoc suionicum TaxID=1511761 RepID=UPI0032DEC5D3
MNKDIFVNNNCYTELVFTRVNKKLKTSWDILIIKYIVNDILTSNDSDYKLNGKNWYVSNKNANIELVINKNNYRLITANQIF